MITVMIPTFNDEDTLEMCLTSFIGLADEMVVVDDCSEDGTVDILRAFAQDPPFKFVWERNDRRKGWVANRQRLLEMATGDVLLSTDSDCVLREQCIPDLLTIARHLPLKVGYHLPTIILTGDIFHTRCDTVIGGPDPNHAIWRKGGKERWFTNPAHTEEYLEDVGFFREPYPCQPPLFHLIGVKSDWRLIERQYGRRWLAATGGKEPFRSWLLREAKVSEEGFDEWVTQLGFRICIGVIPKEGVTGGVRRYDPEKWYPYPAAMQEELDNPRYRFIYEGDRIVGRESCK